MSSALALSYADCRRSTRRTASNFYYSFFLLPRPKRHAMCALYAFLRHTDDLGDSSQPLELRRTALARWRSSLDRALAGEFDAPLFPALADTVAHYGIPPAHLHAVIDGVEMDLVQRRYETFDELAEYCQKVASAVGLCCIRIWGYQSEAAFEPAKKCGIAFQLTNILRDLKEDAAAGRLYLPQEDLRRFAYTFDDLRHGRCDHRYQALVELEIARAEQFYREGELLEQWLEPDGRAVFGAMTAIYRALLNEIKHRHGDVFSRRVRLSTWRKLRLAAPWFLSSPSWPSGPAWAKSLLGTGPR